MKILKKSVIFVIVFCIVLSLAGCAGRSYDNFDPVALYLVDQIKKDDIYEYEIFDEATVKQMWNITYELEVENDESAEIGESYLLMKFYDKDQYTVLFTLYNNGTCCFNRDYDVLYTAPNGRAAYSELCKIFEEYTSENESALINHTDNSTSSTESSTESNTESSKDEALREELPIDDSAA